MSVSLFAPTVRRCLGSLVEVLTSGDQAGLRALGGGFRRCTQAFPMLQEQSISGHGLLQYRCGGSDGVVTTLPDYPANSVLYTTPAPELRGF